MKPQHIRTAMALGEEAVEQLSAATVALVGVGGVGSYAAEALARAGVGRIILCDHDVVSLSNLNRQLCALHSTIGRNKAEVMAERLRDINPAAAVEALPIFYSAETREALFSCGAAHMIDAIDTVTAKIDLIVTAKERGVALVSALGTGNKLDPSRLRISDLSKTSVCPLARVMRRELKARGVLHHRVLWSDEPPLTPLALEAAPEGKRSVPASLSWVPSVAGLMLAGDVILSIVGRTADQ